MGISSLHPLAVRCVNCASSGGSDRLAIVGVIIAAVALVVALGALWIAAREHVVFVRQLQARADFEITVDTDAGSPDDPRLILNTTEFTLRLGLKNLGAKAAGPTTVRVLHPTGTDLRWVEGAGSPQATSERLTAPDGSSVEAHVISRIVSRVALKGGHVESLRVFQAGRPAALPLRIVVQSDDLPDDVEQRTLDVVYRVGP